MIAWCGRGMTSLMVMPELANAACPNSAPHLQQRSSSIGGSCSGETGRTSSLMLVVEPSTNSLSRLSAHVNTLLVSGSRKGADPGGGSGRPCIAKNYTNVISNASLSTACCHTSSRHRVIAALPQVSLVLQRRGVRLHTKPVGPRGRVCRLQGSLHRASVARSSRLLSHS